MFEKFLFLSKLWKIRKVENENKINNSYIYFYQNCEKLEKFILFHLSYINHKAIIGEY